MAENADGTGAGLKSQHFIVTMSDGYESRKVANIQKLIAATGSTETMYKLLGTGTTP